MDMKIAFTGTKSGMTGNQKQALRTLLEKLRPSECLHGACVGADEDFTVAVRAWEFEEEEITVITACPGYFAKDPNDLTCRSQRAIDNSEEVRVPRTMLGRNRMMVDEAEALIATPYQAERQESGGTWYTIDYALKQGKPAYVINPDGSLTEHNT